MSAEYEVIDAWMQHPTMKFGNHQMFDSLRRWTGQEKLTADPPLELTISLMDQAHVSKGLICAWWSPTGRAPRRSSMPPRGPGPRSASR